jgi:predicted DNA-binding protein
MVKADTKNSSGSTEGLKGLSIKLNADLLKRARAASDQTGVAVSFIVRNAIKEWVDKVEKDGKK